MRIDWSPLAVDDLVSIQHDVGRDNPRAAVEVVTAVTLLIERQLPRFPHSGREGRVAGTLELVVPGLPFVVPYRVRPDTIEILRIYHTSRRWPDNL